MNRNRSAQRESSYHRSGSSSSRSSFLRTSSSSQHQQQSPSTVDLLFSTTTTATPTTASATTQQPAMLRSSPSSITRGPDPFLRKPLPTSSSLLEENGANGYSDDADDKKAKSLERHFTLLDLIAVGVGGTIGSGLFVLAGLVAQKYAGPATVVSWLISGLTACLSGFCYAELSSRIPLAGGAYAFNYVASGELMAFVTAACLSLELIGVGAAVSRSWGDKCLVWWYEHYATPANDGGNEESYDLQESHSVVNPMAFLISSVSVALLLAGVKESKAATNFFTMIKLMVVTIMVFGSLYFVQPSNWTPFVPFGVAGVFRGATGTFFGYTGYDQVTSLAGEAQNAKQNLPRAILGTLVFVAVLYMTATLGLTGMQSYTEISPVAGFPTAFRAVGATGIAELVAVGEIVTLPIVILVTIMAQPRLQYAMAMDGLLPSFFADVDESGNLTKGTWVAGVIVVIVATVVPFEKLNDMVSCAVLTVLAATDSSVVLLWHEGPPAQPRLSDQLILLFNGLSLVTSVALTRYQESMFMQCATWIGFAALIAVCGTLYHTCPRCASFGGSRYGPNNNNNNNSNSDGPQQQTAEKDTSSFFVTPGVPFLPCIAIFVNWYLIAQLGAVGVLALVAFLTVAVLYYFVYAAHYSVLGNHPKYGWRSKQQQQQNSIRLGIEMEDHTLSDKMMMVGTEETRLLAGIATTTTDQ